MQGSEGRQTKMCEFNELRGESFTAKRPFAALKMLLNHLLSRIWECLGDLKRTPALGARNSIDAHVRTQQFGD
jgi:hypothetical protein